MQIEAEQYTSMSGIDTEQCSEGTLNVGWIEAGDWMEYDFDLDIADTFDIVFRVASPTTVGSFRIEKIPGNISRLHRTKGPIKRP